MKVYKWELSEHPAFFFSQHDPAFICIYQGSGERRTERVEGQEGGKQCSLIMNGAAGNVSP